MAGPEPSQERRASAAFFIGIHQPRPARHQPAEQRAHVRLVADEQDRPDALVANLGQHVVRITLGLQRPRLAQLRRQLEGPARPAPRSAAPGRTASRG
jgi:hypothetical protein